MSSAPDRIARIDLEALRSNFGVVKSLVHPRIRVYPAVKADAYGHGASEVARALALQGADGFCVAALSEVEAVRTAAGNRPVLLLGSSLDDDAAEVAASGAECVVVSLPFARALSTAAERQSVRMRVHLKVDTGMGRIGVHPNEAASAAQEISRLEALELAGVVTHFPSADEADRDFTTRQIGVFNEAVRQVRMAVDKPVMAHAANSAGIMRYPESHLDAVRPGIMLYGCLPGLDCDYPGVTLRPVMTLASRVVFLKEVGQGQTVSYGRTWAATGWRTIATVSIGYGDGLPRKMSNSGQALVRGKLAPIAGRVCMDQTMLDVTGIGGVALGDEVVFWGAQEGEILRTDEVAAGIGTIAYELTCMVTPRVPRFYIGK